MSTASRYVVERVGVCTSLGLTAATSHAAMRARLTSFWETGVMNTEGDPVRAAVLQQLPTDASRTERMAWLASRALNDLLSSGPLPSQARYAWVLALPEADSGGGFDAESFVQHLSGSLGEQLPPSNGAISRVCEGRASFFFGLEQATELLTSGRVDGVVVGAVDSQCSPDALLRLEREGRVLGSSRDGTLPGEAAAFALLTPPRRDSTSLGEVVKVVTGQEHCHFLQDKPNTAQGLSSVLRSLGRGPRSNVLYTCETGEPFWVAELSMAYLRNVTLMPEPFVRTMAASAFGDCGAAAGAVMFAMGLATLRHLASRGASEALHLLLCGSSDRGQVGACVVRGSAPEGRRR